MRLVSAILVATLVSIAFAVPASAQDTVTLYAPLTYNHDHSRAYFDFQTGRWARRNAPWNLAYGMLRIGNDFDWFQTLAANDDRSLIKDLGPLQWTDRFEIPVIEPLPKLKAGEQRTIRIDVSGADGADGANGSPGAAGANGRRGADAALDQPRDVGEAMTPPPRTPFPEANWPRRPKRDGKPKIDPIYVRAVAGHLYAIHVVSDTQDYYALFRVDSLTRGDNVTISWRLVPAPVTKTVSKEK